MPAELLQLGRIRLQGEFRGKKHGEADRGRTAIIGFPFVVSRSAPILWASIIRVLCIALLTRGG